MKPLLLLLVAGPVHLAACVMPRIVLEQATKVFPGKRAHPALEEVSLAIEEGELLLLAGPSGSGKTTFLRVVAGLESLSSGRLTFDGRSMERVQPQDRNVAMVFQTAALYPHMTAFDNMAFGLKLRGCPRKERELRVGDMAEKLGITSLLQCKPCELSGGQGQRVALGRALVRRPAVLLLDEPFSNLDPALCVELRQLVRSLHEAVRPTTLWSTHSQSEIFHSTGRVALLREGKVQQVGTIAELRQSPANAFVSAFVQPAEPRE